MGNVRDIVRRHVELETLKDLLGVRFEDTSDEEKNRLLDKLRSRGEIDREIESILNAFLVDIDAPRRKKRKQLKFIYSGLGLLLTTFIGYAVNVTSWVFVAILSIVLLAINGVFVFYADLD
ncbi:hypothetical protein [Sulfoacidibacillus thermotolerans]|uniref:Uncharacterized protein n=1 Tax=Sulfoacidibacillus thermotolerans TaxID=1765684 RepID=A0A2U3D0R5_SULT2|nr:hypothetical protein [Sulfoacidibacillus thermotolerans]PWI54872.1 hypothetical protein BM613_13580 [Sulfoacidibacillus thermotolerans]